MAKGVTKKGKDPNAPKRAMSAFFLWMQENRERLKKPGMSVSDVAKAAGVEWGKLTDKSEWEKTCKSMDSDRPTDNQFDERSRLMRAEQEKKRYERELAAYKGGK